MTAPSRAELRTEAYEWAESPMPSWFYRAGMRISSPREVNGWPRQTLTCSHHPDWHRPVSPGDAVFYARKHIAEQHVPDRGDT